VRVGDARELAGVDSPIVDATVGFDTWSGFSNPDVFELHVGDDGPTGFTRLWA
jgi:hypothetical protein